VMPREQSSLVLNQCISCGGRLNISMKISSGGGYVSPKSQNHRNSGLLVSKIAQEMIFKHPMLP